MKMNYMRKMDCNYLLIMIVMINEYEIKIILLFMIINKNHFILQVTNFIKMIIKLKMNYMKKYVAIE